MRPGLQLSHRQGKRRFPIAERVVSSGYPFSLTTIRRAGPYPSAPPAAVVGVLFRV